jgi:toxin secretion/phage lysis holin
MKNVFNAIVSILLTIISYALGGWDTALQTLLGLMLLDFVTGFAQLIYNKKLTSDSEIKNTVKRFGILVIVALSSMVDKILFNGSIETVGNGPHSGAVRVLVIYFFASNLGISILENWAKMDLWIPKPLLNCLQKLKNEGEIDGA